MANPNTIEDTKETPVSSPSGNVESFDPSAKANITQGQLNTILERVNKLESGDTRPKLERPKYNTVLVRFIDGNLVVGYGNSWDEKQPDGSWRLLMEVKYKKGDKILTKKVDSLDFRQKGEQLEVKVLKVEMNEREENKGKTTIKNVDFAKFRTVDTGIEVPMTVITPEPVYTVEMPDGTQETLSHLAVN